MVLDLCGGEPSQAVTAGEPPLTDRTVSYDPALTRKLAGVEVETARQREILSSLGFAVAAGAAWQVRVPSLRRDVDRSEERHVGQECVGPYRSRGAPCR